MIYKKIDISQSHLYQVSTVCAKAVIDWRLDTKKGMSQRVFDNALKQALECSLYGMEPDEALDRWQESNWTGMKWVLAEAKRESEMARPLSTRQTTLEEDLTDKSWVN